MATNCSPLLFNLFLYSYEFIQNLIKDKTNTEAEAFNLTFRNIDVLSINKPNIANWIPLIYHKELEMNETTEIASSVSFLVINLQFDTNDQLSTKLYDKRDDFNFAIINFPHLDGSIQTAPDYTVYISQLVRYGRAGSLY